ncbi:hypothetical protein A3E39_01735 [Candidatus Uhrbacteria bacterium RIFCSPHIGHO2_12_FULL_60_25]|uniref:Uncharacterized protein n=1 Tax=Candidatus Uhrbacteria bacterium RIFCSPHIGHO2_12_FULL_60_25 TaxID=1802399 RepID=A0A1F7UKZ2_9BACT|nr:MAG: hypothetical protein A3D73_02615 [Candidatus Uhrbacteria bacterium RIFCSPHIGHO2_02_FULL_60_44]OGL78905.1 MAG: hypothetical protein A3E39_01735 [Candidatus Uhrbacteria bacterium RIFCSPHIGHO2_12_FULL_60_25]
MDLDLGMFEISRVLQLTDVDPRVIAVRLVNASLELLGILALVMIVLGGFRFMVSGGNPEKTKAAAATIRNAIIGLIMIMSSWAFAKYVLEALVKATASDV